MIRVIEHGNTVSICTCEACNCKFSYDNTDVHSEEEDRTFVWQKPRWKRYYVDCPECRQVNLIREVTFGDTK